MKKTKVGSLIAAAILATSLTACSSDADVASENLSKDADNFKILRRIVFYNAITDSYILSVEGYCSIGNSDDERYVSITCKIADGQYKKHFFFKSDNTTVFAEQIEAADVSTDHYKVIFKPSTIIPDVDAR